MNVNFSRLNKLITHPSLLAPTVFIGIGASKTFGDYQKSPSHQKKQTLAKDVAILTGSVLGFALMNPLTSKLCTKSFLPLSNKFLHSMEYVLKQSVSAVLNTFMGVTGAVCANTLMQKYVLNKKFFCPPPVNIDENPDFQKANNTFKNFITITPNVATKAANRMLTNISDIPAMKVFSAPMIALTGFSIANTEGLRNKVKRTTNEILANSLIPTFFVSVTSLLVGNKKNIIKIPALLASLGLGSLTGMIVADKSQKSIERKIDSINFKKLPLKFS